MSQIKRALLLQLCGIVIVLAVLACLGRSHPIAQSLAHAQQRIGAMEFWGGVLYPLLYAACNVLLLPGGVLAIGSGFFFGLWWGSFLNIAGNVTGAAVAFLISRKLGRQWVSAKFLKHQKWAALDEAIARDGWKIIFLSQVHPLFPSSLLNYLYGVTRIRFGTCMLWITLGQAPGLFLYAYLGTLGQYGLRLLRGKSHPQTIEYVIWIGGFVVAVVVTVALARIALRLLAEIENRTKSAAPHPAAPAKQFEEMKS